MKTPKFFEGQPSEYDSQRKLSFGASLKRFFSPSGQSKKQKGDSDLLLNSGQEEKPKEFREKDFRKFEYKEWVEENSKDLDGIFNHRLSRRQIMEKAMVLLPPETDTDFVKKKYIKEMRKELEEKYRDRVDFKDKANIKKDLEFVKRYEKELRGL